VIKKNTTNTKKITIRQEKGRLTQEEVDRILREAEKYKAEDETKRLQVQAKNDFENFVYQMRNTLDDSKFKDLIKQEDRERVDEAIKEALKWNDEHSNADKDDYDNKKKELEEMWRPIITAAYGSDSGSSGMPNMGNFNQERPAGDTGPKIDEVD